MNREVIVEMLKNHRKNIANMRTYKIKIKKLIIKLYEINVYDEILEQFLIIKNQYAYISEQVDTVNTWLVMLADDERLIISKHLVGGLTWPHVIFEYENKWGMENGRSERTLKRIQANAINKILNHIILS